MTLAPNAARFAPLPPDRAERWNDFASGRTGELFPAFVGLRFEEVRTDYARMRLPYRAQLDQPVGIVHGGAIATLIDTVVVPAIGSAYDAPRVLLTIGMTINYLGAVNHEDAVAEGWVERRGKSTVFCRAEVHTERSGLVTTASLVYKAALPR